MDWYVEAGGNYIIKGEKVFGRNIFVELDTIETVRKKFKNTDVFMTVYAYDNDSQDQSNLYGAFYLDLDINIKGEADYNKVKKDLMHIVTALNLYYKVPLEYIKIYFSGNKGFHIVVPPEVFNIKPHRMLNIYYKHLALQLKTLSLFKTVDSGIYDNKRLLRLPNSINGETGLYKVPITFDFAKASTYKDMVEYASSPKEMNYPIAKPIWEAVAKYNEAVKTYDDEQNVLSTKGKKMGKLKPGKVPKCIATLLENGATKGNRNNITVIIASSLLQSGLSLEQTLDRMLQWNNEKNSPKLNDKEVMKTVTSAHAGFTSGKKFGCGAVKGLGFCTPTSCKLANKIQ
jgi:hypothetical protein